MPWTYNHTLRKLLIEPMVSFKWKIHQQTFVLSVVHKDFDDKKWAKSIDDCFLFNYKEYQNNLPLLNFSQ